MKVLITDPVDAQCVEIFESEGFTVDNRPGLPIESIKEAIRDADALIVRSQTKVSAEVFEAAQKLKVVGRAGAGVDNIDVEAATRRGVIVMNTPGGNTVSTAEHAMSLLLALVRNIPQANRSLWEGKWDRKTYVGAELYQKTVGIVGLGKVGKEVARRCQGFEMKVIAFDPVLSTDSASKLGIELVSLDELFRRSDIISIHSPLTAETKNLIDEKALQKCKRGVRIINCARGGIVSEKAVYDALQRGHLAGAAFDVFEEEPPSKDHHLINHPKVVSTPHLGASTEEAQEKVAVQIAQQVSDLLKDRGIMGSVNADVIQAAMQKELRPYLVLAEKLGKLIPQVMEGTIRCLTISTRGQLLDSSASALTSAVLKGMFEILLTEPVNYLNAPFIAKERGIVVQQRQGTDDESYTNLLTVSYETESERRKFAGTVFGSTDVRIVDIDGFHFEVKPEGNLLIYYNIDRPGMLANVSKILANAQINIAGLSLGRFQAGERALTVIASDVPVPPSILQDVASIDGVSAVRSVQL